MNLQENIERIHEIMGGVITEDRKEMLIKNMVDSLGLKTTIEMLGGYYEIEPYLKDADKVNYIKYKVSELGRGGVSFHDMNEDPILIYKDGDVLGQIEFLGRDRVYINTYHRNALMGDKRVPYENLPGQIIDELVEILTKK